MNKIILMSLLKKARKEKKTRMEEGEGGREEREKERKQRNEEGKNIQENSFILSSEPGKNVLAMKDQESEARAGV